MGKTQLAIKRILDILFSAFGLIVLSPVFLVITLLMWQQHNGPVLFKQVRIGYKARPFVIYKFRTMSSVIEENGPDRKSVV